MRETPNLRRSPDAHMTARRRECDDLFIFFMRLHHIRNSMILNAPHGRKSLAAWTNILACDF